VRILLTGATGFIGSAFGKVALASGNVLAGLVRPGTAAESVPHATNSMLPLRGTLAEPPWREIAAFRPEVCVHTAWITTPGAYLESQDNALYYDWSLAFLKKAAQFGARHIVVLGTCIEYRIGSEPLSEATPLAPSTAYARWKDTLRSAIENEFAGRDIRLCWARLFYPYGIGEHPQRLCSSVILRLLKGEKIVLSTPDSTKDYIHVDDVAKALLMILEKNFSGPINLGTGQGVTVRAVAELAAKLAGRADLIETSSRPVEDPFSHIVADARRLRSLGWRPEVNLETGLSRLIRHLKT
jgi:nucleoside-diphosphate-sugar epimerase